MSHVTTFKEFLRLAEIAGAPPTPFNPAAQQANNAIINKAKTLAQTNPTASATDLLNQATLKTVTQGTATPAAVMQAMKTPTPGQPQPRQMMMRKGMRKK